MAIGGIFVNPVQTLGNWYIMKKKCKDSKYAKAIQDERNTKIR